VISFIGQVIEIPGNGDGTFSGIFKTVKETNMTGEQRGERDSKETRQQRFIQEKSQVRELTDEEFEANIIAEGVPRRLEGRTIPDRLKLMKEDYGFRVGGKAEYVVLESCNVPFDMYDGVKALKNLLDYFQVDYTLLPKSYCCAIGPLIAGVRERNEERVKKSRDVTKRMVQKNIELAKALGAKTVVTLCQSCDTVYRLHQDSLDLEVIWYPELIERFFTGGKLKLKADYYAGCYRLDSRLSNPNPPNLDAVLRIMKKIEGLDLNYLNNDWCCKKTKELESLVDSLKNDVVISACCGCYAALSYALGLYELHGKGNDRVKMLTEVVWDAVKSE
jgi:Fe-S oxidoreductase